MNDKYSFIRRKVKLDGNGDIISVKTLNCIESDSILEISKTFNAYHSIDLACYRHNLIKFSNQIGFCDDSYKENMNYTLTIHDCMIEGYIENMEDYAKELFNLGD